MNKNIEMTFTAFAEDAAGDFDRLLGTEKPLASGYMLVSWAGGTLPYCAFTGKKELLVATLADWISNDRNAYQTWMAVNDAMIERLIAVTKARN